MGWDRTRSDSIQSEKSDQRNGTGWGGMAWHGMWRVAWDATRGDVGRGGVGLRRDRTGRRAQVWWGGTERDGDEVGWAGRDVDGWCPTLRHFLRRSAAIDVGLPNSCSAWSMRWLPRSYKTPEPGSSLVVMVVVVVAVVVAGIVVAAGIPLSVETTRIPLSPLSPHIALFQAGTESVIVAGELDELPKIAARQHALQRDEVAVPPSVVKDGQQDSFGSRDAGELGGFRRSDGEGFFADNVLSCFER